MKRLFGHWIAPVMALALVAATCAQAQSLKVASPQRGSWEGAIPELGKQAGIFQKHGIDLDILYTSGGGETLQVVISGAVDIGLSAGTAGALGAFSKGAPIRIIGASSTGSQEVFWYTRAASPVTSMREAHGKTISYSTTGASSHITALRFISEYGLKDSKAVASGDVSATITQVMSGQIDLGWAAPPFGLKDIAEGKIRIVATGNDAPSLRDQTVRVDIASLKVMTERKEALARYVKAYRETLDWMYADPRAIEMWAANIGVPVEYARKAAFDFQPKAARDFDTITGLDKLMEGAVRQKFLAAPLTKEQLSTLIQIVK